jgi:hypothetical protein
VLALDRRYRRRYRTKVVGLSLFRANAIRGRQAGKDRILTFGILSFVCALALSLTNCGGKGGGSSAPPPTNNPVPSITSISPTSATAGGAAFTLTVNGSNFISSSSLRWGGASRTTTYVSSTQLTASITANDIASAATVAVTVFNPAPGGGTSNSANFTISGANNPVPTLTSLNPPSAVAGGAAFNLVVTGTGFGANSVVRWNGAARTTTFTSSTQLQAGILATDVASTGAAQVTVFNPAPGGGTSNAVTFNVTAPSPLSIGTTRLPDGASSKPYDFTLAVSGGVPPYTWSVTGGALPSGLALGSSTGEISGTSGAVGSDTTVTFTVRVSDNAAQPDAQTRSLSILVHAGSLGRNDTCSAATATKISNGVTRASISPYGDVDVYTFQGTAGQKATIEIYAQRLVLNGDPSTRDVYLDSFLELLDSSCNQIAFNDDIDLGVMQDSLIENFTLPGTGTNTYYIRVSDLGGDGRPDFIYDLHLSGAN